MIRCRVVWYRSVFIFVVRVLIDEVWIFFFFQAEDGIRDLVRSRGLGDVYKRQGRPLPTVRGMKTPDMWDAALAGTLKSLWIIGYDAVSYTHLTLPTSDLV